jgi:hypothetical protein
MIPDSVLHAQHVLHPAPGAPLAFAERAAPMSHFRLGDCRLGGSA